ncbi:hypothetical protein LJD17_22030 [Microvirga rosea]|nr:hypothetical protein [Microvirga rosea]
MRSAQDKIAQTELGNKILRANMDFAGKVFGVAQNAAGAELTSRAALGVVNFGYGQLRDYVVEQSERQLEEVKVTRYAALFAKAKKLSDSAFSELTGGRVTEQNIDEARRILRGADAELVDTALAERPQDRDVLVQVQIRQMNDGLARYAALSNLEVEDLNQRIKSASDSIQGLEEKFRSLSTEMGARLSALENGQKALTRAVDGLSVAVEQNASDISYMQGLMWKRMTAGEQRAALESRTFFRDMPEAERKKVVEDLAIVEKAESAQRALGNAAALADLGRKLGVLNESQHENLVKNIDTAKVAVNTMTNFASGNWVGMAMAAGGLMGGGGDPNAARQAEIMSALRQIDAKLNQLIALNKQILEEVRALNLAVEESKQTVLAAITNIERRLDRLEKAIQAPLVADWNACDAFINSMSNYGGAAGIFGTYSKRKEHFDAGWREFRDCIDAQSQIARGTGNDQFHSVFFLGTYSTKGAPSPLDDPLYELTRNLTYRLVSGDEISRECQDWLFRALIDTPSRWSLRRNRLGCTSSKTRDVAYKTFSGFTMHGDVALDAPILVPAAERIGRQLQFLLPYRELVARTPQSTYELKSPEALAAGRPLARASEIQEGDPLPIAESHIDILNISIAQQSIYSGGLIADQVFDVMASSAFGEKESQYLSLEGRKALENLREAKNRYDLVRATMSLLSSISVPLKVPGRSVTTNPASAVVSAELRAAENELQKARDAFKAFAECKVGDPAGCDARMARCGFRDLYLRIACALERNPYLAANVAIYVGQEFQKTVGRLGYAGVLATSDADLLRSMARKSDEPAIAGSAFRFVYLPDDMATRQRRKPWGFEFLGPSLGASAVPLPTPKQAEAGDFIATPDLESLRRMRLELGTKIYAAKVHLEDQLSSAEDQLLIRRIGILDPALGAVTR